MINWDAAADALAHGDLRDLPDSVAEAILALSWHEEVRAAVLGLGIDCLRAAIALGVDAAGGQKYAAASCGVLMPRSSRRSHGTSTAGPVVGRKGPASVRAEAVRSAVPPLCAIDGSRRRPWHTC